MRSLPGEMSDMPDRRRFLVDPFKVLDSLREAPIQLLYATLPPQNLEPYEVVNFDTANMKGRGS